MSMAVMDDDTLVVPDRESVDLPADHGRDRREGPYSV